MTDIATTAPLKRVALQLLKVLSTTVKGYKKDGCGLQASALTYITMVSLVPMLAIMFSFSKGIGMQKHLYDAIGIERVEEVGRSHASIKAVKDANHVKEHPEGNSEGVQGQEQSDSNSQIGDAAGTEHVEKTAEKHASDSIVEESYRVKDLPEDSPERGIVHELPESMQKIIIHVFTYVDRTNFAALGIVGSLMLIIGVVLSIAKLEKCFNLIWGVSKGRGLLKSFPGYLVVLIVAPLLIVTVMSVNSLLMSEHVLGWLSEHIGAAAGLMVFFCKLFVATMLFLFFVMLYIFMPNTRVKARAGFFGGFFACILWFIVLWAYLKLQIGLAKYNTIYGTFAALPFFLAVLYSNWCIVLLGCEFSYAVQYHRFMRLEKNEQPMPAGVCLLLGQLAMYEACKAFAGKEHSWNPEKYAVENSIPMRQLRYVVGVLVRAKLLLQVDSEQDADLFVPGCPPDTITLATVEEAFRENDSVDGRQYFAMLPEHLADGLKKRYKAFSETLKEVNFEKAVALEYQMKGTFGEQEAVDPAKQKTVEPAKQETVEPAKQETTVSDKEETVTSDKPKD
ncbi:MAG: YihY/virulence factor BrkB family protein [Victivallales bacterium]|nr:YihY/virulence factor BrkB family protein [Victivallales bacterium]